jgi:hypothetical protein
MRPCRLWDRNIKNRIDHEIHENILTELVGRQIDKTT